MYGVSGLNLVHVHLSAIKSVSGFVHQKSELKIVRLLTNLGLRVRLSNVLIRSVMVRLKHLFPCQYLTTKLAHPIRWRPKIYKGGFIKGRGGGGGSSHAPSECSETRFQGFSDNCGPR